MKIKPVVIYIRQQPHYIKVGDRASVYALNHPVWGARRVETSTVIAYSTDTGEFMTLNTHYKPLAEPANEAFVKSDTGIPEEMAA